MPSVHDLTRADVARAVCYDPSTGRFYSRFTGKLVGSVDAEGYATLNIRKRRVRAHRAAFMCMTGSWPGSLVDHRDGDRANNSWNNLRLADALGNSRNCTIRSDNKSGFKGVSWNKRNKKWIAYITLNSRPIYIGAFEKKAYAAAAYNCAALKNYGEFAKLNHL